MSGVVIVSAQVLAAGCGQNPARQAAMRAGLPEHVPALTINKVCGSGLKAVALAANAIRAGDADVVVAGGQENMSASPHVLPGSRDGWRMGDVQAVDTMIRDGLWDAFNGYHMGTTAENVARQHGVGREQQDAVRGGQSEQGRGRPEGRALPGGDRPGDGATAQGRAGRLRDGRVRAPRRDARRGGGPQARVREGRQRHGGQCLRAQRRRGCARRDVRGAYASAGLDPAYMGLGPVPASRRCLERAGWGVDDLDLMEINEAFAAQACAVNQQMGWDAARINVNGGAIAIGHPIGASGARILVTLLHEMRRRRAVRGLASLCIGGGMGIALAVER